MGFLLSKLLFCLTCALLLLLVQLAWLVSASSDEENDELNLTSQEKAALDKFKSLVIPKIPKSSYIQNYTGDELYFLKWVRANSLNVPAAEEKFLNHLKWRASERIDSIEEEDWSEFQKDFPVFLDTFDKAGRPAGEIWYSEWNPRTAVLTGRSKTLNRWLIRYVEILTRRLFKARASGALVTRIVSITDLEGFSLVQHACPACMVVYTNFLGTFENHYPYLYKTGYLLNIPPAFGVVLRTLKPFLSGASVRALKPISNRDEWMAELEREFNKGQRSTRFGGTRNREL